MACDCKETTEAKLIEHFKAKHPTGTDVKASLMGYGIAIDAKTMDVVTRAFMPIEGTVVLPRKAGGTKLQKIKSQMFFKFCPFCGVAAQPKSA